MEQNRILWIVAAVGVFLLIVIGAALIFYPPYKNTDDNLARVQNNDTWIGSQPDPSTGGQKTVKDLTVIADRADIYSGTIDLNAIGNTAANAAANNNFTTVNGTVIGGGAAPSSQQETPVPPATQTTTTTTTTTVATAKSNVSVTQPTTAPQSPPAAQATAKATTTHKATTSAKPSQPTTPRVAVTEYWIQAGSFSDKVNAEEARTKLLNTKIDSEVFTKVVDSKTYYRVRIGPYKTKTEAEYWLGVITNENSFSSSYISEVKTVR